MTVQIRFWWHTYSPDEVLESFDPVVLETPFEVSQDLGRSWRRPKGRATLETIHDWMIDEECSVVDTQLHRQRHFGDRWEGQYILIIDRNPKKGASR